MHPIKAGIIAAAEAKVVSLLRQRLTGAEVADVTGFSRDEVKEIAGRHGMEVIEKADGLNEIYQDIELVAAKATRAKLQVQGLMMQPLELMKIAKMARESRVEEKDEGKAKGETVVIDVDAHVVCAKLVLDEKNRVVGVGSRSLTTISSSQVTQIIEAIEEVKKEADFR